MRQRKDITGNVYGKLTALSFKEFKGKLTMWNCICECGNTHAVSLTNLRCDNTKSCGCSEGKLVHGFARVKSKIPEHSVWTSMKSRCLNKSDKNYHNYGGRGIMICDRWLEPNGIGFKNFIEDMGRRPSPKHSIERQDNDKGYSPENCVWIHNSLQSSNTRASRKVLNTESGFVYPTISSAARENNLSSGYLRDMLTGNRTNKTKLKFYEEFK